MKTIGMNPQVSRGIKHNSKEQGIALTVMLIVLAVAATLSFGTLFLTQNNLKVAENIRNHAIAKYNAEAGIEVANIMLTDTWVSSGEIPNSQYADSIVPLAVSATDTAFDYYLNPDSYRGDESNVYLAVVGKSSDKASYDAEMLAKPIAAVAHEVVASPFYTKGLVSKGKVTINGGGSTQLLSAGVHGNEGYSLSGKMGGVDTCTARDEAGICTNFAGAENPASYFTAAFDQGSYSCKTHHSLDICKSSQPANLVEDPFDPWNALGEAKDPPPPVINPRASLVLGLYNQGLVSAATLKDLRYLPSDYDVEGEEHFSLVEIADTNRDGVANHDSAYGQVDNPVNLQPLITHICPQFATKSKSVSVASNQIVCVTDEIDIPSVLNNAHIIVKNGDLEIKGDISGSSIIALDGDISINGGNIDQSVIFASDDLDISKSPSVKGMTSLLADDDVDFQGRTVVAQSDGHDAIGMNVVSLGDISLNGRSSTYGIFQTRGAFTKKGHTDIYGSVLAEGNISMSGGVAIDASMPVADSPTMQTVVVSEVASMELVGRR